jgi:hypothetical protein
MCYGSVIVHFLFFKNVEVLHVEVAIIIILLKLKL